MFLLRERSGKCSISFGLVNIPIALCPATGKEELKFRLLRAKDLSPVNYKRVAEKDGKEVPWDDIVKGYEYEKGKYVVLKDEDFQRVDLEATQTVDIQDFVDQQEIDPIFFYKPYYLEPQKGGDKAYVLLRETLQKTGKVGIAKVVIKTRQYLAGVKAKDSVLVLELMHFAEELADADKFHIPKKLEAGKRELDMAKALIDSMSSKWDPKKYRDDYREALMEAIEEKVEAGGKEIEEKPKPKSRPSTKVIDLVSVLQESLNKTKNRTMPAGVPPRRDTERRRNRLVCAADSAAHTTSRNWRWTIPLNCSLEPESLIPVIPGFSALSFSVFIFPMTSTSFILSCCLLVAATLSASEPQTGIEGLITVGPAHGGPTRMGVPDSRALADTTFTAQKQDGTATSFTTDGQGRFRVSLQPGHYTVSLKEKKAGIGRYGPFEVDVVDGQMTKVEWRCDTGMR